MRQASPGDRVLDLTFPPDGMTDAYTLLSQLSAATPPIPVLVLTGTGVFTDRGEAVRRGRRAFLSKTLLPREALDATEQFLARDHLAATRVEEDLSADEERLREGVKAPANQA